MVAIGIGVASCMRCAGRPTRGHGGGGGRFATARRDLHSEDVRYDDVNSVSPEQPWRQDSDDEHKIIKTKVGVLGLAKQLGNVSRAQDHGLQPRQLLSVQSAVCHGRRSGAARDPRRKPNPRIGWRRVEAAVVDVAIEQPRGVRSRAK